jgi:hypothetical protein
MKNTLSILLQSFLVPVLSAAQTQPDSGTVASSPAIGEKTMIVFFIVSAILLFLAGKFLYDLVIRKKH